MSFSFQNNRSGAAAARAVSGRAPATLALVFVAGAMERVGTNYIGRLLLAHPEVCRPEGHWELPLLDVAAEFEQTHSQFLGRRAEGRLDYSFERFARCFGDGLMQLFVERAVDVTSTTRFLLHKNPSTRGLDRFRAFFPDARLILLVRDGRDNVNSLLRAAGFRDSSSWSPRRLAYLAIYARKWALSARRILDCLERDDDCLLVRYEALHGAPMQTLREIASYAGLALSDEWLAAADSLPVTGSSFYGSEETFKSLVDSNTNWRPERKTSSFKPVGRWREHWSRLDRRVFERIAGPELRALGYGEEETR